MISLIIEIGHYSTVYDDDDKILLTHSSGTKLLFRHYIKAQGHNLDESVYLGSHDESIYLGSHAESVYLGSLNKTEIVAHLS